MKLRLPKQLCAALMAAAAVSQIALADYSIDGDKNCTITGTQAFVTDGSMSASNVVAFTLSPNAVFEASGDQMAERTVTMGADSLINITVSSDTVYHRQIEGITLTGNAGINMQGCNIGVIASGHGNSAVNLGGHTLTLSGGNSGVWFRFSSTTFSGRGEVVAESGVNVNLNMLATINEGTSLVFKSGSSISFSGNAQQNMSGGGTLDFSDYTVADSKNLFKNMVSTSGTGAINLTGDVHVKLTGSENKDTTSTNPELSFDAETLVKAHYEFSGSAAFNGKQYNNDTTATRIMHIGSNPTDASTHYTGSLTVQEDLRLMSGMKIAVHRGGLTVGGSLILGHDTARHPGHILIDGENAAVKLGGINVWTANTVGTLEMTAGSLEFSKEGNVVTYNNNCTSSYTIKLTGGTLKATTNSWALNHNSTIGSVSIETAKGKTISLGDTGKTTTINGTVSNAGSLALKGTLSFGADGAIANTGLLVIDAASGGKDALVKTTGAGDVTIKQNVTMDRSSFTQATGTLTVQGTSATNRTTLVVQPSGTDASANAAAGINSFSAYVLDNAVLDFLNYDTSHDVTLDKLTVKGNSSLGTYISGSCWHSTYTIGTLIGEAGSSLELHSGSKVVNNTLFHLNGSAESVFKGDLTVKMVQTDGGNGTRRVAADINADAATLFQNSVITLDSACSNSDIGLGINADATIKALRSDGDTSATRYIFSGGASNNPQSQYASGTTVHTLTLGGGTTASDVYTFNGNLKSKLNLIKNGDGTQIFNGDLSAFDGTVTINGGTLGFGNSTSSQLTFARNISGEGKLLFSNGNIKYTGKASNTGGVLIDGGATVELVSGGEESKLKGTVTVKSGSTLKLSAGDATGWNKDKEQRISQLILDGGTLTVANTGDNQTFAGGDSAEGSIILKNGTINHASDAKDAGNIDLFSTTSKIAVLAADDATENAPTVSTIDATLTLRRNGWTEFSVAENAKLNVSQTIRVSDDVQGRGSYDNKLNKTGAGAMHVTAAVEAKEILLSGGSLTIDGNVGKSNRSSKITISNGNLELGGKNNLLTHVDADNSSSATGSVLFKSGSVSTVSTTGYDGIWMRDATHTKLLFEKGAKVITDNVILSGRTDKKNGEMYAVSGATKYTAGATNAKLTDMILEATANKTVSNVLVDSSLKVNTEGVTLTENQAENTAFVGIYAENGIINLLNKTNVSVEDLTIGSASEVGVYQGDSVPAAPATANEANISVSGTLSTGSGATLNANLTMKNGSTIAVDANGGLTMGSSVTIAQDAKINLSDNIINGLNSLTIGEGLTLFSGVDAFNINGAAYNADTTYHASDFFNLSNSDVAVTRPWDFVVKFDDIARSQSGGVVYLYMETPEPATATLSLLALAALAARRRRK